MRSTLVAASLALLLGCNAAISAQRVWVVATGGGSGVDFTEIQAAVDAAAHDDTIVVRAGAYAPVVVNGKGLVIVADGSVSVGNNAATGLEVRNLPATRAVVVRGIDATGVIRALNVEACLGPVTIEDCDLSGILGGHGGMVNMSTQVSLLRCRFQSGFPIRTPGTGVIAANSTLHAFDCEFVGGSAPRGSPGSVGLALQNCWLTAHRSQFVGGAGAPAVSSGGSCVAAPYDGGHGLEAVQSTASCVDCILLGGPAGAPGACPPANAGQPFRGAVTVSTGVATALQCSSPVRTGQSAQIALSGPSGAVAWLALAPAQRPLAPTGCNGTLYVDLASMVLLFAGFVPANGLLPVNLPVPPGLTDAAVTLYCQSGMAPSSGGCFLGTPTAITLLAARF